MLGLRVNVPIACFRKGYAREYLETEQLPPPATAYGFLLSLIGETDRYKHIGARVTVSIVEPPPDLEASHAPRISTVLRTLWRVKNKDLAPGAGANARPDFQQLLSPIDLVLWLDSEKEENSVTLESRVAEALYNPASVTRFGGLCLGESAHLVDSVDRIPDQGDTALQGRTFTLAEQGRLSLPIWVDHVGSKGTRYAVGDLTGPSPLAAPAVADLPVISPG